MGDEPETACRFQCGVSLKYGCCAMSPFVHFACEKSAPEGRRRLGRGAKPAAGFCFLVSRQRIRGGGKVGNLLLVFHFSIALVAGTVGMWESRLPLARFPRGSWKEWEACFLAFHSFHSPGISTALWLHRVVRQRANKLTLAFCIR